MAFVRRSRRFYRRRRAAYRRRRPTVVSLRPSFRRRRIRAVKRSLINHDSYFTRMYTGDAIIAAASPNTSSWIYRPNLANFRPFQILARTYEMFKVHKVLVKIRPTFNTVENINPFNSMLYAVCPIYQDNIPVAQSTGQPPVGILANNDFTYGHLMNLPQSKSASGWRSISFTYRPKVSYVLAPSINKQYTDNAVVETNVFPATISRYPWISTQGYQTDNKYTPTLSGFALATTSNETPMQPAQVRPQWNVEIFCYITFRKRIDTMRPTNTFYEDFDTKLKMQ